MIDKLIKLYRIIVLVSSLVCLLIFGLVFIRDQYFPAWRQFQNSYAEQNRDDVHNNTPEIRQIVLKDQQQIDRCISCHVSVEDSAMETAALPLKKHSGNYLSIHEPEKFGCSLCHRGQGRVPEIQETCREGKNPWSIHSFRYIQSNCGRCHLAIFEENLPVTGTEKLMQGLKIFRREGCLGCHKVREVGGTIGPDLTDQGSKSKTAYNFAFMSDTLTVPAWLTRHFRDPQTISPGSPMLRFNLAEQEMEALVTLMLGLFKPQLPLQYYSFASLREFKSRRVILNGAETFGLFCSACHGKDGEGKEYKKDQTGVPMLNNPDFLAVASRDLIEFTIQNGRSRRQMASWAPQLSGLKHEEIFNLVNFIRQWHSCAPSFREIRVVRGNVPAGKVVYGQYCAMCHGPDGLGGVATGINDQDFLRTASDEFLYETIVRGRYNTAMPSWSRLSARELADVVALIRSWQRRPSLKLPSSVNSSNPRRGDLLFHNLCERCHGKGGSGGVGPAVLNKDFLKAASDEFLFITIANGREHSPMFGWKSNLGAPEKLTDTDIGDVIAYMKSTLGTLPDVIYPGESTGNPETGRRFFEKYCSECHGYNGEGVKAPSLHNQEFLNAATNGYILATISLGRSGTAMPSWGRGSEKYPQLSGETRNDIVAYIRSWQEMIIRKNY
jgi:mono/diheme cytochrome c family protein